MLREDFNGFIRPDGTVIYCCNGDHALVKPDGRSIKLSSYGAGYILFETENYRVTQSQLDSLYEVCQECGMLEVYRRYQDRLTVI
jgi:hypothetical protein